MSRSIFGWSYPPGCSGPPDEPEYEQPRCKCGCFLGKPARQEPWEASSQCDGSSDEDHLIGVDCHMCGKDGKHEPHKIVWDNGVYNVYECKRCKAITKI